MRNVIRSLIGFVLVGALTGACGGGDATPTAPLIRQTAESAVPEPETARAGSASQADLAPRPAATPYASAMPLPTPQSPLIELYQVRPGDTLGGISLAYDVSIAELVALNDLGSEAATIQVNQVLRVPLNPSRSGPTEILLPDSEVVYSPAYRDLDVPAFVAQQGGTLASYTESVNGVPLTGGEIVQRIARQYSVGPRVLLALLEFYGGWVTAYPPHSYQPLGPANPYYDQNFALQLAWAANRVNEGYYKYKRDGAVAARFLDGSRALIPAGLNAGTVGVQNILALNADWESWPGEMQAFMATYRRLFGDPFARAFEPLVPADLTQPPLQLPWEPGQTFYYTGGPHAAYGSRSAWGAVDFAPPDIKGNCYYSQLYVTAAADGRLVLGEPGELYLDLDGDGDLRTGWVLLYLHVVVKEDLASGQAITAGTPLGYASCEGGVANSSHLHLARRYNGEWLAADGPVPMVLSGWRVEAGPGQYDGTLVRDGVTKTACECWDETLNALVGE